jgi:sulfate adenylyltransferase subunit 2
MITPAILTRDSLSDLSITEGGMENYILSHLDVLEAEAIHIMREVAAEFQRPVMLFSGGKDSICMLRLAEKAFRPSRFPFPLLHIDTGHNFPEVIEFRDRRIAQLGERLIVRSVQDAIDAGIATEPQGNDKSRNWLQIPTLLNSIEEFKFDAAFGGARRDEEKARAKERVFSFRDEFGQWDPRNQRPELWNLYNTKIFPGQHIRVFPLSNWTELDIWQYIERENLEIPSIYFAHERDVFERDGLLMSRSELLPLRQGEAITRRWVRYRTVGDIISTAAMQSRADSVSEIIAEITSTRITERGARADDRSSETAMEDRKREGYF